ncbi:MAG: CCA tRNA nucleotidyltransferase [Lachnospiraceae bacterium]|nr:CCA tRNA nucleotidyltransferase [Lachnospiraceae bacterium]
MRIKLPASVNAVLDGLHAHGYEAYAVGGCVRDAVLGRKPDDWDITTSATPWEVKELFYRTVDTGLQHGTVTVLIGDAAHEVTTYRIDGEYEDSRHPKEVTFTASLQEDLKRRDFTINAMAYNQESGLVDLYGGISDLQRKTIRCVGAPKERFGEDALRIFRALRFAAQLGFTIEKDTLEAIRELAPTLRQISAERIQVELTKMLVSPRPEYMEALYETGITAVILPEFDAMMKCEQHNPHHCYTVGMHTIVAMSQVEPDKVLRFTMLLHDMGKPACHTRSEDGIDHFKGHAVEGTETARKILRRLRFDNDTIHQVTTLVYWHDCRLEPSMKSARCMLNRIGAELFEKLLLVQRADTLAQSEWEREQKLQRIKNMGVCLQKVLEEGQCFSLKELAVTGQDLIAQGVAPGPKIGEVLQEMLMFVLEEPDRNQKEYLLQTFSEKISAAKE